MSEVIKLDPSAVASGRTEIEITPWIAAEGPDYGDAQIEAYVADQQIGSSPVDYRLPNRTIRIPLRLRTVGATSFSTIRLQLQQKAALAQREGGWVMRQVGATSLYADVVNATLHLGGDYMQAFKGADVNAVLTLECLPDWYGDEVTLADHVETTKPELIFTEATVNGNNAARVRLVVDNDDPTLDQHGLLWGLRSRYYDSASTAALAYEAEALTPLNGAAGTALAGASGGTVVRHGSLPTDWTAILSTNLTAGSALTHHGSYRVWARCYSASATPRLRLAWGVGGLSAPVLNDAVSVPAAASFYLLDLGAIRVDPPPTAGLSQWFGALQAQATTAGDPVSIDRLFFQPLDDGAGRVTYTPSAPLSQNNVTALPGTASDDAATGSQAWTNPTAITAADGVGAVAQFASTGTSHYLKASNFGFSVPSTATITGIQVLVQRYWEIGAGKDSSIQLMKAGAIQATNRGDLATPWPMSYASKVYGSNSDLWGTTWSPTDVNNSGFGVALVANCLAGGHFPHVDYMQITVYYTLATGFTVAQDAVIYATRSIELRTEGMFRQDPTGTVFGPVSQVTGDLPRLPPSGLEARTVEVFLKATRGNFADEADAGIDDISARVSYRPSFLYIGE